MSTPRKKLTSYQDLRVWQKAMDLVEEVYRLTPMLPATEKYGLASQMQRAVASIPSNIAEGYGRQHRGEYIQYLSMSNGSLKELETQVLICVRLNQLEKRETLR